jgi:hypothetical protein
MRRQREIFAKEAAKKTLQATTEEPSCSFFLFLLYSTLERIGSTHNTEIPSQ